MLSLKFLCKKQKILKTRPSKSKRIFTRSYLRNNADANTVSGMISNVSGIATVDRIFLVRGGASLVGVNGLSDAGAASNLSAAGPFLPTGIIRGWVMYLT
jgi:hypothetical protein